MLNDTDNEALRNVLRRCIRGDGGKCEWTGAPFLYDLTYEHTMEMYDRFYRFDNASDFVV